MKTIYCIPGLVADHRIFRKLQLPGYHLEVLEWMPPIPNETISAFAQRMADRIPEPEPILMGVSMGGIMCTEVAKIVQPKKVILVSTIKSINEKPIYIKKRRNARIHHRLPFNVSRRIITTVKALKGDMKREDFLVFRAMLKASNRDFFRWGLDQVLHWENELEPNDYLHLHGDADKLFPLKFVHGAQVIKGGSHFMLVERSEELSGMILKYLTENHGK